MTIARAIQVLNVTKDASPEALKDAFRTQALRWHPDLNPSEVARARFQEARQALDIALAHNRPRADGVGAQPGGWPSGWPRHADGPREEAAKKRHAEEQRPRGEGPSEAKPRQDVRLRQRMEKEQRRALRRDGLQRKAEKLRVVAQKVLEETDVAIRRLGLRRGAVLVASPQLHGFFANAVVLVLKVNSNSVWGVIVSGGPGGPPTSNFHGQWTIIHAKAHFIGAPGFPVADGAQVFSEEHLTKSSAVILQEHLNLIGEPSVLLQGRSEWRAAQLIDEVETGHWSILAWGSSETHMILQAIWPDLKL